MKNLTEDEWRNVTTVIESRDGKFLSEAQDVLSRWQRIPWRTVQYCLIDKDDAMQDTLKSGAVPNKAAPLMPRAEVDESSKRQQSFPFG